MLGVLRSHPSFSNSTSWVTRTSGCTDSCRRAWKTRLGLQKRTVLSSPSKLWSSRHPMSINTVVQSDLDNDFDHLDPVWIADPYPIWDEMRQNCPVAHTDKFNGVYFPSRYADVRTIAYDSEHFSSRRVVVRAEPLESTPILPPITS